MRDSLSKMVALSRGLNEVEESVSQISGGRAEGTGNAKAWDRVPGRRNSKCKGPEATAFIVFEGS